MLNGMALLNLPMMPSKAGQEQMAQPSTDEAGFEQLLALLESALENDTENPVIVTDQLLQLQPQVDPDQFNDEQRQAVAAWVDGLIGQQSVKSDAPRVTVQQAREWFSEMQVPQSREPVAASIPVNSGDAARTAISQLPNAEALYTGSVVTPDRDETALAEHGRALSKDHTAVSPSLNVTERALFQLQPTADTPVNTSIAVKAEAATLAENRGVNVQPSTVDPARNAPLRLTGDEAEWGAQLNQRLVTLVGDKVKEARIRLDPPELGQLGVKVVVEDNHLKIRFATAVPHVRDMIEGQADRLRAAFDGAGFARVDVDVRQNSGGRDGGHERPSGEMLSHHERFAEPEPVELPMTPVSVESLAALDVFA